MMKTILILIIILIFSCKRDKISSCEGIKKPSAKFEMKEVLSDTSFLADTIFNDNSVEFNALEIFEEFKWTLGNNPTNFIIKNFRLPFYQYLGTIPVTLIGKSKSSNLCFPDSNGIYTYSRTLTLVEQIDKTTLILSPLIGTYRGSYTISPSDFFTIKINYFDSSKYAPFIGRSNFYWISNFPKNYRDTTTNAGIIFPELSFGQEIEMGYKCGQFGTNGLNDGKNFLELKRDSLIIYEKTSTNIRKVFIGKKS